MSIKTKLESFKANIRSQLSQSKDILKAQWNIGAEEAKRLKEKKKKNGDTDG